MKLEKQIEEAVCEYARGLGILVRKYRSPSAMGVPDRIFWMPGGRPLLIEFKKPSGVLSPRQHAEIISMRKLGYRVLVIDNIEEGIHAIDKSFKPAAASVPGKVRQRLA